MLQRFVRRRRAIALRLLAVFALFLGVTAVAPCVMASPDHPAGHDGAHRYHDCQSLAKLDCQASGQQVVKNQVAAAVDLAPVLPVLAYVAPQTSTEFTASSRPQRFAAEAIPRPPLILQYAVLLI
jgi:hypothetical protein